MIPPKVREPVAYRTLTKVIVEDIYVSPYRRAWLAANYNLPLKQITLIKRAATREEAVELYGH